MVSSIFAAPCCIAPTLFIVFGISAGGPGFLQIFEPYRAYFLTVGYVAVGYSFYKLISFRKKGFVKMLIEKDTNKLLEVHIVCQHASEIIHKVVPFIKYNLTLDDLLDLVDVYPTLSESIKLCAISFRKDIKHLSCCAQ